MPEEVESERKRCYRGGSVSGIVSFEYRDDWQRAGVLDVPATVCWFYETGDREPCVHYLRWMLLRGQWENVPYLDVMVDGAFTTLMIEARRAARSSVNRYLGRQTNRHAKATFL